MATSLRHYRKLMCFLARCHCYISMIQILKRVRHLVTAKMKPTVSEFRMPVPWGEIRGRIWGPDDGRPVLCLHGWGDNSGTFNTLIPLLPRDLKYVAIDLPGHGFSSHRPAGVFYTYPTYFSDVRRVIEVLQWKRFSIIGHSMGGNIAGMFSVLYPEMVDSIVLLDSYGFLPADTTQLHKIMRKGIDEMTEYEKIMDTRKEKVYSYEAAKERLKAVNPSLSDQSAQILLERGLKEFEGGVVFTRDFRINLTNTARLTLEQSLYMQSQIKAKVLILWASQGFGKSYPQFMQFVDYTTQLRKGWDSLKSTIMTVEGDHHVHLNNPDVVAPFISDFLLSQTSEPTAGALGTSQTAKL
ncbi:serine hydrolase-like protein isoform X2 [Electrophorus electricus]|uniref:AB hydrolase-1 domain-containing protein n=2 Tax=Electrophorus electricus TaxID=8005 RepID=A0A4W4GY92_ELEEL|nr:serine hydrolase-like protein isoform X2 [Electrophorus electricus]